MVSVSTETITASLIKLSFYMGRIVSCIYEHSFYLGGDKENQQFVFRFTPLVAPIQCAISVTDPNAKQLARSIYVKLTAAGVVRELDLSGESMGNVRTDELGVPFTVVVDSTTSVTIRERDSNEKIKFAFGMEAVEEVEDVVDAVKNLTMGHYTWGEFVDRRKQWLMETTTLAYGEETLVDKSLLTISSTMVLQMHGLTQAMAREIVREESDRPGDRSRLWITSECFGRLKVMKLSHCRNLTSTPDFIEIPNLEELILEGCVHLLEVHPSIRTLKKLVALNLRNCTRLASFPCKEEMDSLRVLILSGCLKVYKLIEVFGTINTLVELHVDLSAVTEFPYLFYTLSNLQVLSIGRHQRIESRWWVSFFWTSSLHKGTQQSQSLVFSYLASLRFLTRLNVSDCNISEVSSDIGSFSCLEVLNLSRNKFTCLLTSLSQLSPLKILILNECKMLEEVPELPCSIISFHASSCTSLTKLGSLLDRHRNFSRRMVRLTSC
ncbi:NB-ARC domains-containing protein [Tanacetum coccineum]